MPYNANAVANAILDRAEKDCVPVTPMQLLKLVYIAHGWHLAVTGEPLIDEPVRAWQYGPVIRSVYDGFKRFGRSPITSRASEHPKYDMFSDEPVQPAVLNADATTNAILDRVWTVYGKYTGPQLMHLTHQANTPWSQTWVEDGGRDRIIPDGSIREHFVSKVPGKAGAV